MKRLLFVLALAGFMVTAGSSMAQYRNDAILFTINAGGITATSSESGQTMSGNTADLTLEKVLAGGRVSTGISIPFIYADETVTIEGMDPIDFDFNGTPVLLTCKYNILNGRFAAYAGAGIGIHSSTLKVDAGTTEEVSKKYTGITFGVPVGIAYFLDDDFYLQGVYNFRVMKTTPLTDGINHGLTLGMGFQWGAE